MSEFEDRENELGELPPELMRERGTTYPPTAPQRIPPAFPGQSRSYVPPDVQARSNAYDNGAGELGSPVIPATVTSTFDARPINARDWKITTVGLLNRDGDGAPATQTLSATYNVPAGYVGVMRGFQFSPRIVPWIPLDNTTNESFDWVTVTILVNNIVQADYDSLKFGPTMDRPQEVFVLAGETQTLTIQVNFLASFIRGQSIFENFETTPVLLQMYGNALLTRGLPTPFEIATQIKSGTDTGNQK